MNRVESALTTILIRYTYGFHRNECTMTWNNFMTLSSMSKTSVQRGTKEVIKRGYFKNSGSKWYITDGTKMIPKGYQNDTSDGTKMIPERYQNDTNIGTKMIPHTNKANKGEIKSVNKGSSHTPSHFSRFDALNQHKTPDLLALEKVIKGIVMNPADTVTINDIACLAERENITPAQIVRWFGEGATFWYEVSFGKSNGLPPYARNILNELKAAQRWEQSGAKIAESGEGKELEAIWQVVVNAARMGEFSFQDSRVKKAVQKTGWGNIRTMTNMHQKQVKSTFIANYKELQHANGTQ